MNNNEALYNLVKKISTSKSHCINIKDSEGNVVGISKVIGIKSLDGITVNDLEDFLNCQLESRGKYALVTNWNTFYSVIIRDLSLKELM